MSAKISTETKRKYFTMEFTSMGDITKDGLLSMGEFQRLMMLLAYPGGSDASRRLFISRKKSDSAKMTCEEYLVTMFDPNVDNRTAIWRNLFAKFDLDGSGSATKQEVLQGLKEIGVTVDENMRSKIEKMDANKDGKVSYGDFLRVQLQK